ncbi:GNAT family N-acetyltransferase [Ulvibacterium sp.]|uniref:GNAT family N-acetyltransferase n=1 Tax=Ulvibacterium sp. TaxID=2665914 RepID=UPI003BAA91A1
MLRLKGEHIHLRALEPEDLEFLYQLENNPEVWEISGTTAPYSKHVLKQYLENAHRDIYDVKQLRLCICTAKDVVIGFVDLFDFDPKNRRAGIGIILIAGEQGKGVGTETLRLLCDYAFSVLDLRQLYANVTTDNERSLHLFRKLGFEKVGTKKDWIFFNGNYRDEILFQKINT